MHLLLTDWAWDERPCAIRRIALYVHRGGHSYLFAGDGYRARAAAACVVIIGLPRHQVHFKSDGARAGDRNRGSVSEWPGVVAILRDTARVAARAIGRNIRPSYGIPLLSFPVGANAHTVSAWHVCSPL